MSDSPFPLNDAQLALMAHLLHSDQNQVSEIATRLQGQTETLRRCSLPLTVAVLGSLLTRHRNHAATQSIEALIHLAALTCRGVEPPTITSIRSWITAEIRARSDVLSDPPEDVFVSNVETTEGNFRLFQGYWNHADYHVQGCLLALSNIKRPWSTAAQRGIRALLRLSEAIASRQGVIRNTPPNSSLDKHAIVNEADCADSCVYFTGSQLDELKIDSADIAPFVFDPASHRQELPNQRLPNTVLERRPILRSDQDITVALPTAIAPAIIRFALEAAQHAGDIELLVRWIAETQFEAIYPMGLRKWSIDIIEEPELTRDGAMRLVGRFDLGSYVQILFVPDPLRDATQHGLQSPVQTTSSFAAETARVESSWATNADYRRGLTICVSGGVGRPTMSGLHEGSPNWYWVGLTFGDFLLLEGEAHMSALHMWKILDQQKKAEDRGTRITNAGDFMNLYAWQRDQNFEVVPRDSRFARVNLLMLTPDFVGPFRHSLRTALDRHVAVGPNGRTWVPVQSGKIGDFLAEGTDARILAMRDVAKELAACVLTNSRRFWISCTDRPDTPYGRTLALYVWRTAVGLLARSVRLFEETLGSDLPDAVVWYLRFPALEEFDPAMWLGQRDAVKPDVLLLGDAIEIRCSAPFLGGFCGTGNIGDHRMLHALAEGAYQVCGRGSPNARDLEDLERAVIASDAASFFGIREAVFASERLFASVDVRPCRLDTAEDSAASRLGVAAELQPAIRPGEVPASKKLSLLHRVVQAIWERIAARLGTLDRESVAREALTNFASLQKDRRDWESRAAALIATHSEKDDVAGTAAKRESARGKAGLASRVIAEMAICACPVEGGAICGAADLDALIAHTATLVGYASVADVVRHAEGQYKLTVYPNGVVDIVPGIDETSWLYLDAQGRRTFQNAVDISVLTPSEDTGAGTDDAEFQTAFQAEFGIGILQYAQFLGLIAEEAIRRGKLYCRARRSDVLRWLSDAGVKEPVVPFERLTLTPRPTWDEENPQDASPRDWYPWRYNRRLSVTRRPIVQVTVESDPVVLLFPTSLEWTLFYLLRARAGDLPESMFNSQQMKSWIGRVIDQLGHAFNQRVGERFRELDYEAKEEVSMASLGASAALGDIDVLAWDTRTGNVYVVECKRLRMARTVSEIAERLTEYTEGSDSNGRTPLQKHLDRMAFLETNQPQLARETGISEDQVRIHSTLVTDGITPMEFAQSVLNVLDCVANYDNLDAVFGRQRDATSTA